MTTKDVANKLVEFCRKGEFEAAMNELYSNDIVSIEPAGSPMPEVRGIDGVRQKAAHFASQTEEMHGMTVSDPVVADSFFSVSMGMDITMKGIGRTFMEEVALYQVNDGKIVREEFFFTPEAPQG